MTKRIAAALVTAGILAATGCTAPGGPERVQPNDNTRAAGTLANGVLTVAIETRAGAWRPEGDGGKSLDSIYAFAESGHAASTPGPLIRVPIGTSVHGTIRNTLGRPLIVFGLTNTHKLSDSLVVPADSIAPFEFTASEPGTFLYLARTHVDSIDGRDPREQQLQGVIVVDKPDAPPDRILAISWYLNVDLKSKTGVGPSTMVINGLSWPHTERLTYAEGDSVRWRIVNFTEADHPMHLHGFYFRVNDVSADGVDTAYSAEQQRMAVTEVINPQQAVNLSWKADRPGNWVFHCHYASHLSNFVALDTKDGMLDSTAQMNHPSDRPHQMFGLVMGITVTPKGPQTVAAAPERFIRIVQREKAGVYGDQPGLSYILTDDKAPSGPAVMPVPGAALVLERGKRVQVTVVNESDEHAAVHWHGIELESYSDGVPGWSGSGQDIYPAIAPHDSLTVRWTPPRAGSFMYHSHFNESGQMGGGLYGPIIVLEPGERFDPETDRILFFGTAGRVVSFLKAPPTVLLNGSAHPEPMQFKAGTRYRFRLFSLAGDNPTMVSLTQHGKPVVWRAVAKDGYPLPASQATARPATLMFDPGEIYDFEFTPSAAGELTLSFGLPQPPPPPPHKPGAPPDPPSPFPPTPPLVNVAVHVR